MPKPSPGPPVNSCCKFHPPPLSVNTYTLRPPCAWAPDRHRGPFTQTAITEGVVRRAIGSRQLRLQAPYSAAARKDVCGSLKEILAISPDHRRVPLTDTAAPKASAPGAETSGSLTPAGGPTLRRSRRTHTRLRLKAGLGSVWELAPITAVVRSPTRNCRTGRSARYREQSAPAVAPRPRPRSTGTERPSSRRHPPARRAETPAPGLGKAAAPAVVT